MKAALSILIGGIILAAVIVLAAARPPATTAPANVQNVSMENGTQVVRIDVRGGYQPRASTAKAGVPTVIRFVTNGTFDCSSFIRIPSLNISKTLPNSGQTDISLGTPAVGTLQGMCGMGMYRFSIDFQA